VLVAVLVATQLLLYRRTGRRINPLLAGATLLAAGFVLYLGVALAGDAASLRGAKEDAFDSVHALWKARATAYEASSNQVYYLLAHYRRPVGLETASPSFAAESQRLAKNAAALAASYAATFTGAANQLMEPGPAGTGEVESFAYAAKAGTAVGPAPVKSFQAAAQRATFKGYLGDELRNITFPGEGEAAVAAARDWLRYIEIDRQIRELETTSRHDHAIDLATGVTPGQSEWAFAQFDRDLGRTLEINEGEFAAGIDRAFAAIAGLVWAAPATALLIILLAWFGLQPRIAEYAQ
jgi:hypothetical protein